MVIVAVTVSVVMPLVGAALAMVANDKERAGRSATVAVALSFAAALVLVVSSGVDGDGALAVEGLLDASVDRAAAVLLAVVMGTATVVAGFSSRSLDDDGRAAGYFARIGLAASGSAMVIVPAAPVILVVGWVLSGWALIGLVGFESGWSTAEKAKRRVRRTLMIGDLALVSGVAVATFRSDGLLTGDSRSAVADLRSSSILGVETLDAVMILIVIAGASRSAMVPFHRWLIGTLAAPTPVSALVHAGLVSGAGLVLIRFAAPFVESEPAVIAAFTVGVVTVVVATGAMLVRSDIKGSLAWSTVAQMAFMVIQCSVGAFSSAVFHIAGHGMYKAALFLGSGDTVTSGLRSRRRPAVGAGISAPLRLIASVTVATFAVAAVGILLPPDVAPAGEVLVYVFAWLTIASGMHGWLGRSPAAPAVSIGAGAIGAVLSALAYLGGLRLFELFLEPSLAGVVSSTVIGPSELAITLAAVGLAVGWITLIPGDRGAARRDRARQLVVRLSEPALQRSRSADGATLQPSSRLPVVSTSRARRAEIRADVARAGSVIAPQWPLASFVAVNPLGGLESMGFDDATDMAQRWRGAKTHLDLAEFRLDHANGLTRAADLAYVAQYRFTDLCERGPVVVDGQSLSPVDVIVADLLHGPESAPIGKVNTALHGQMAPAVSDVIDDVVSSWLLTYVSPPKWGARRSGESFVAMSRRLLLADPRVNVLTAQSVRQWIADLGDDPAVLIDAAFTVSGVEDDERVADARSQLCRLAGWAGLAKWRTEWALPDEQRPPIAPVEIVAVRALLEAGVFASQSRIDPSPARSSSDDTAAGERALESRVDAVVELLAPSGNSADRSAVRSVLAEVPERARATMWLEAQERAIDARVLSMLDRLDPGKRTERPDAQLVFCIDVRSEGLRSQIEALGNIETIGFAGFFGVPMRIRKLGWDHAEARCPVLVSPAISATERARHQKIQQVAAAMTRQRFISALFAAHAGTKYGPGSQFALAETAGWFAGPAAARRTFLPSRSKPLAAPSTQMILDDDEVLLEQRTFFAESVLKTMGLTDRFAPLVILCGHTSRTINNAHATALECGACAGASGDDNARAVAALLNSPDVRHGLGMRGIAIPDDTWFTAGLHDTASDRVTLLDIDDVPAEHLRTVHTIDTVLEQAGERQAAARSVHLPGSSSRVRERGADWAQVRPEWGLARNAVFIIGPRSMTAGLDFEGRAFLHSYDADDDPTGRALETIMTAPLVVGHWISAQYYFSTVDPEVFGAGNKLLHNPIGTTGVISGDRGDLRVGLPLQSTHLDGERFHQPVRLLAVIQADLARIENIIANNPILRTLTGGSWLRIAARSHPHERWSTRTSSGTWIETPRAFDPSPTLNPNKEHQ